MGVKRGGWVQRLLGRGWVEPEEVPAPEPAQALRDNEVDVLQFDGRDVRTIWLKGDQWWVAADVCAAIEIKQAGPAVDGLDEDEKGVTRIHTPGGFQQMAIVNEPGLYHLLSKSNKAKAKAFWRWVRHDVLPSIRQTGSYSVDRTPIRGWIRKRARRHGFPVAWQKKRQKVADGNKAADAQTFAIGGDAVDCSTRYNALYLGLFNNAARQLKAALGCRAKDSPLDHMADVPLAFYDAASSAILLKMKDGTVSPESLPDEAETAGQLSRRAALDILGAGYDFRPIEDQKGRKILEATRELPGK